MLVNVYGRSNRGDSVLLDAGIAEVRDSIGDAAIAGAVFEGLDTIGLVHPDVAWSSRIGNARRAGPLGRAEVVWCLALGVLGGLAPWLHPERLLPRDQRRTFEAIRDSDLVISAPGGYIQDSNYAYLIALLHIWLGVRFGRPTLLAPQSVGPVGSRLGRWLTRRVLARTDLVCARESYTVGFLTGALGLPEHQVRRTGDSAFWNDDVPADTDGAWREFEALGVPRDARILGMTVCGWEFGDRPDPEAARAAYVDAMARVADAMAERHGLVPVIFNQVDQDLPTARLVRDRATTPILVDEATHEPGELRAMIARSVVFLGTRFHSCIFALLAGRPTFAVAYLPKTTYIMQDLGLADRHLPIHAVDAEVVLEQLEDDLADVGAAEQRIVDAVESYRQRFARLSDVIASLPTVSPSGAARPG